MNKNGELHSSTVLQQGDKTPNTPWVGIRNGLEVLEKRDISCLCQELNPVSALVTTRTLG
jgi:hypothetical protein